MTPNLPNISDTARYNLADSARLLGIDPRTLKRYAACLCIRRRTRLVGGYYYEGRDLKRIWTRNA